MVSPAGRATLMDFGVAKALAGERPTERATMTNATVGTVAYMSPEQMLSADVLPASDIYSLGVVAYELLTGRVPFDAPNTISMITRVLNEVPQPVDHIDPRIPAAVARTIDRALEKQPGARFASAGEFAEAFAQSTLAPEVAPFPDPPRDYTTPATRLTPALVIYLIDLSASMSQALGGHTRIDVVKDALRATLRQMVFRSTRGRIVAPRYRIRVLGYSSQVYDLLGGVRAVDELASQSFDPDLIPLGATDTAMAFAEAERLLLQDLPGLQECPAPIVCHLTDGEYTGDDPEPIAQRIKQLRVADGNVVVENIFVSDGFLTDPLVNPSAWSGVTARTSLLTDYARKLRRMSSPLPESYRRALADVGFQLANDSVMLLPGTTPELVRMAFQISGMTGAAAVL
jgi:hypothetical protein